MQAEWNWRAAALTAPLTTAGQAGVDHDQPSQATKLYLHRLDDTDTDRGATFQRLTRHDVIYLQDKLQAASWHRYTVADRPYRTADCWIIPVETYTGSIIGTEPANNAAILVSIQGDP
jgi:hypothetical protein